MNSGDPHLDEEAYLRVIRRKTAKLFEAAAQLGAVLGGAPPEREAALARYGMHLGTRSSWSTTCSIIPATSSEIGKNLGDDLAEGKMTLPLIRAIAVGSADDAALIRAAITDGRLTEFAPVVERARAHRRARLHARAARSAKAPPRPHASPVCPHTPYRKSLLELASFAARRTY